MTEGLSEEGRRAIEADCERLIKRYVNLNDAQDWEAVADLYTADARFARPSKPGEFLEGRAAILAGFLARPPRAQRHAIANIVVEVDGPAAARAFSVIVLYQGDPAQPGEFIEGRAAILASFLARPPRAQRHAIANVVVDVDGPAAARAFSVIVLYQGEAAGPGEMPAMSADSPLVGTFTDKLVLTDGGWRFAERVGGLDFRPGRGPVPASSSPPERWGRRG